MKRGLRLVLASIALSAAGMSISAGEHRHDPGATAEASSDARQVVHFPVAMRIHTLANMRDHLLALQEIEEALGRGAVDKAADIAEQRLGMSSLRTHGAQEIAPFMPEGMQRIGTEMHRAASRFSVVARDAGATGDIQPALSALAEVMAQCVACHSTYRVQ
jgi:hypothetical protein